MQNVVRLGCGLALLFVLALAPTAWAQADQLQKAIELFDRQEYVAAQEALLQVEREQLDEAARVELDRLLQVVPEAIQGSKKAEQDQADASVAYEEGRWDEAEKLYRAVLNNKFAKVALRDEAAAQCQRIEEKRRLAEAAKPQGPVEGEPAAPDKPATDEAAETQEFQPPEDVDQADEPVEATDEPQEPPPPAEEQKPAAPPAPQRMTLVQEMRRADDLLWQRAVAKMQEISVKARDAVAAQRFDEARRFAEHAVQVIETARAYAEPASKYEAARAQATALKQEVADAYERHSIKRADQERKQVASRLRERADLLEKQRAEKIEQLFNTAGQLRQEQRFAEAADVLRQILYIDPANARARYELDWAEDYESFYVQKNYDRDRRRQTQQALTNAAEATVPWDYEVLYPKNWLELSARRAGAALGGQGRPDEDIELNRKLSDVLPDVRFEETPFETVVEFLADLQKVNISVDWEDLDMNGIERDKPVTVKLVELTFRTVLNEVLTQVGGDVTLSFSVGAGLLRIATKEKLDRDKAVLVYDIRDLTVAVPRYTNAARLDPAQALNQLGQGGGGGGGGGSQQLFQTEGGQNNEDFGGPGGLGGAELVQEIMDIIRQTVEPDSWRETGGGEGSLRELNGQLIVYNTSDAHQQVADLLSQLRQTRALQVAVETRFLNVTSNFLEEMGVDLDFVFNSGSAGFDRAFNAAGAGISDPFTGAPVLMPRTYSQIGATPATPGFGNPMPQTPVGQPYQQAGFVPSSGGMIPTSHYMTPIPAQQGSMSLVNPANLNTGVPGSLAQAVANTPALSIAGSFLDNLQVDFLIRATQANARSSIVQAPRLLMPNGGRANITIGRARQYVGSVTPQLAEGVVGVTPQLSQASSGTTLDVDATISADRRYVTVTIQTTQSKEPRFERFEVQRASGNSPGIFVTLLDQEFTTINTQVTVPDGGTVLLGGLKQVGEIEVDAGVPILSKIPILKRAFTNTTTVKDTQTLLILLKAKIIIQKEAEEEAFPTMISAAAGG